MEEKVIDAQEIIKQEHISIATRAIKQLANDNFNIQKKIDDYQSRITENNRSIAKLEVLDFTEIRRYEGDSY